MSDKSSYAFMVDAIVNHEELQQYYHVDTRPERKPLVIYVDGATVSDMPVAEKFGARIVYRAGPSPDGSGLSMSFGTPKAGNTVVDFRYPAEGVVGRATFEAGASGMKLSDLSIAEE